MTFSGRPVEVQYRGDLRDAAGHPAHAATWIRRRMIVLDRELRGNRREHGRILTHELYHFAWVRLGNARRRAWEELLRREWAENARGEAGWSAEWRKRELARREVRRRGRRWREYCCEAFCDTAAWVETGAFEEVTLGPRRLAARRAWFAEQFGADVLI